MPETRMIAIRGFAVAKHRLRALRQDAANALTQSVADQGQLQPIVVRQRKDGGYWLVAGLTASTRPRNSNGRRQAAPSSMTWRLVKPSWLRSTRT
jgi:ParB-like nuclease family protein